MKKPHLFIQVIIGMMLGICIGFLFPAFSVHLKIFATVFIRLIKTVIAPIIFISIVLGISSHRSANEEGKMGTLALRTLVYFEIMSITATLLTFSVFFILKPGDRTHIPNLQNYTTPMTTQSEHNGFLNFVTHMVPDNFFGTLASDNFIAIVILSTLSGIAILKLPKPDSILNFFHEANAIFFKMINLIALLSPLAAFGAIAATVGESGGVVLIALSNFIIVLLISMVLFCTLMFLVAHLCKIRPFALIAHIKEEILVALGTSSSESIFPQLMTKLTSYGCSQKVVGFVLPTGYAFNLDGTAIYITAGIFFLQQLFHIPLTPADYLVILGTILIVSKGAAGVAGAGFITLSAVVLALPRHLIPVEGLAILLGIDRLMSDTRTITNVIGNSIGTVIIAKAEGEFKAK